MYCDGRKKYRVWQCIRFSILDEICEIIYCWCAVYLVQDIYYSTFCAACVLSCRIELVNNLYLKIHIKILRDACNFELSSSCVETVRCSSWGNILIRLIEFEWLSWAVAWISIWTCCCENWIRGWDWCKWLSILRVHLNCWAALENFNIEIVAIGNTNVCMKQHKVGRAILKCTKWKLYIVSWNRIGYLNIWIRY